MPKRTIVLDFNTKFISPEKNIWVLFPGRNYRFFQHFMANDVVFGDLPGVPLLDIDLDDNELLKRWIAISEKVKSFYLQQKDEDKQPSRDPTAYKRYTWTGRRTNARTIIRGLYSRAQKGDLVLVTSKGGAWGKTRIGEFSGSPEDIVYEHHRMYGDEIIPARRVRWIGEIENRSMPEALWHVLTSPNAFSQLARSYHNLIFRQSYGNFIRTDVANSLFDINSEEYSTVTDMYLKFIANFSGEVVRGIENHNLELFFNKSFDEWFFNLDTDAYYPNQKININSPGQNLLHSVKITPILAAVFFAICQFPADQIKAANLSFVNSAAGGDLDDCDIPVVNNAKIAFELMSLEKLEQLCRVAMKAQQTGNVTTPIKTRIENDE